MSAFDLIVIGGGPGGYVCAIKAAQLGMKVACVEKRSTLGGTCLNVGCIPSKALLHASEKYVEAQHHLPEWGVQSKDLKVNLKTMLGKKDQVVKELTQGIDMLFKKNKVTSVTGMGTITAPGKVTVTAEDGKTQELSAKNIVIATGSKNRDLPGIEIDEERIVSSTGALSLSKVPKKMVVIGGGYIGLELGSVWQRLGAQVTVVEFADRIVPAMDQEVGKELLKNLQKQGMEFRLGTKVLEATKGSTRISLGIEEVSTGKRDVLNTDVVLVSIGRQPNTEGLGLKDVKVATDRGMISVNGQFQTSVPGIYAIGDVIQGPMLAHKAEEEGVAVAEILEGQHGHVNYETIPAVIYTSPEVASVGKTQEQLKEEGTPFKVGKFPFMANSRAKAVGKTTGFVKILAHKETDRVLGMHIIAPDAGTLIAEGVLGMEYKAASEDIARTCHAHPTTNEAVKEAALAAFSKPLHS